MPAKPETQYIARLHRRLPKSIYHLKNHNPYAGGVPDVWYSGDKGDLWVEYKYVDPLPKRVPIRISGEKGLLSALQLDWLDKRYKEGRKLAVIIGCKQGGVVLENRLWHGELGFDDFCALIQSDFFTAQWIENQVAYPV